MSSLFIDTPHLVFQSHETQTDTPLEITQSELTVIRELALQYAEIAALPIQNERKKMWSRMNGLQKSKPMIWANEICWHEMDVNNELALKTSNELCNRIETELRRTIYQWKHMQGDMIVESVFYSPFIINNTGFGIGPVADVAETNKDNLVASRHFHNQIMEEEDIEKIKTPVIIQDIKRTDEFYQAYKMIFDGILDVGRRGCPGFWFAPWDDIVFWMGADEVLINLALKPELMHKLIDKLVTVYLNALDQFEKQGLLALNSTNTRIGSGAYGYTDELPQKGSDPEHIRTIDIWGSATAQIFGSVSPAMHEEFGLDYEIKWLERFGMTYYGCCEPLHNKMDILGKIPNLRKISISPWANVNKAAEYMKDRYVVSLKPSPSVMAMPVWDPDIVRQELETKLAALKDCSVEIVIKDISTVKHEPWRLWEWMRIAAAAAEKYAG